jgi:hypothetical protein
LKALPSFQLTFFRTKKENLDKSLRELDSISQQPSHSNLKNLKSKNSNFPQRLIEDFNKKGKVALSDFMIKYNIKYNQESTEAPYKSKDPAKLDSYGSAHQRVQSYTYHHYLRAQLLDLLATLKKM